MTITFPDIISFVREVTPLVGAVTALVAVFRSNKTAARAEKHAIEAKADAKEAAKVQVNFALSSAVRDLKRAELVPQDFSFSPPPSKEGGENA